jgi:hypothetical protein
MKYLLILFISALFVNPCSKEESKEEHKETNSELTVQSAVDSKVYLGRFMNGKLIVEDNATYTKNEFTWAKDSMECYDRYCGYLKTYAKKYNNYKEDKTEYVFDGYKDEFKKLTNLRIGDKLNISSAEGVFQTKITKYYMNFDDMVGSGVVFYAIAEPVNASLADYDIVICSDSPKISGFNRTKMILSDDPALFKSVTTLFMNISKDIKVKDESSEKEKFDPVTSIDTSELVIFPGSFTSAGAKEYIAGYTKRQSFDNFAYYIIVVNEKGETVKVFAELIKDSFTFETIIGIVDENGDGIYEILTEDGYYEGSGYNLHKLEGKEFKAIVSGFFFGV